MIYDISISYLNMMHEKIFKISDMYPFVSCRIKKNLIHLIQLKYLMYLSKNKKLFFILSIQTHTQYTHIYIYIFSAFNLIKTSLYYDIST